MAEIETFKDKVIKIIEEEMKKFEITRQEIRKKMDNLGYLEKVWSWEEVNNLRLESYFSNEIQPFLCQLALKILKENEK